MFAKFFRSLLVGEDQPPISNKRKRPHNSEEDETEYRIGPAKRLRQEYDHVEETQNILPPAMAEWFVRTKDSISESLKKLGSLWSSSRNMAEGREEPQERRTIQHPPYPHQQMQPMMPPNVVGHGATMVMGQRFTTDNHPTHSTPVKLSSNGAHTGHTVTTTTGNFKTPLPRPAAPVHYHRDHGARPKIPTSHRAQNIATNGKKSGTYQSMYDKTFSSKGMQKLTAKESIRMNEKEKYALLLQQFTSTGTPTVHYGSRYLPSETPLFHAYSRRNDSVICADKSLDTPSFFRGRDITYLDKSSAKKDHVVSSTKLSSAEKDLTIGHGEKSFNRTSTPNLSKVSVKPTKEAELAEISSLSPRNYTDLKSLRTSRQQALDSSKLKRESLPKSKASSVCSEDVIAIDSDESEFRESTSERSSSPVLMFERSLAECPVATDNWISDLKSKYSSAERKRQQQMKEAEIKQQYFKERREDWEAVLEQRIKHKLRLAERYPAVLEEKYIEEEEDEFPELTEEMENVVDNALQPNPPGQVLCDAFRLQICRKDMHTLAGLNWLNDEVINFYMNLLMDRGSQDNFPSVHAFNTFFYPKLMSGGHQGVKRWTKKKDILALDFILVPVHLGMHWCLAVVDLQEKVIKYFDSMGNANNRCLQALLTYLCDESLDKRKETFDTTGWQVENVADIPQQMNGSDCGVFACKFAEYVTRRANMTFSQENMPYFRRRMVYEIMSKRLL